MNRLLFLRYISYNNQLRDDIIKLYYNITILSHILSKTNQVIIYYLHDCKFNNFHKVYDFHLYFLLILLTILKLNKEYFFYIVYNGSVLNYSNKLILNVLEIIKFDIICSV